MSEYRMDVFREGIDPSGRWDTLAIVLPDICKECNGGWMRDLELAAQPILTPMLLRPSSRRTACLHVEEQTVLAAWALKTSMLLVAKLYKNHPAGWLPADSLQWLRDQRGLSPLPPGARVWLACVDAKNTLAAFMKSGIALTDAGDPIAHVGTFSVGYIAFQVFCREVTGAKIPPWRNGTFPLEGQYKRAMLDIWPATDSVTWPPEVHFEQRSLFELAQRFNSEFIKIDSRPRIMEFKASPRALRRL